MKGLLGSRFIKISDDGSSDNRVEMPRQLSTRQVADGGLNPQKREQGCRFELALTWN